LRGFLGFFKGRVRIIVLSVIAAFCAIPAFSLSLKSSNGLDVPLCTIKPSTPALNVQSGGTIWYGYLATGTTTSKALRFDTGGKKYYLTMPPCGAGNYLNNCACAICPQNNYCPGDGTKIACDTVGSGYTTDGDGASAASQCHGPAPTTCAVGWGLNNNLGGSKYECGFCLPGYYSDDTGTVCTACPAGTYSSLGRITTCETCPMNNYCPGASVPIPCHTVGKDYVTAAAGQTSADQCFAPPTGIIVVFTDDTTYTVPGGYSMADVFAVGGGGGGGHDNNKAGRSGWGGVGGQVVYSTVPVFAGQNIAVTIGAGGAGSVTNGVNGSAGGVTAFGDLVSASGGIGGTDTGDARYLASEAGRPDHSGVGSVAWTVGIPDGSMVGADGTMSPFTTGDAALDGKLFGAGGGGGMSYNTTKTVGTSGGKTGGGSGGGYISDGYPLPTGSAATFYGGGGGGAGFSSSHSLATGGAGYQGIVIIRLHN